jgi:hypothetical protein
VADPIDDVVVFENDPDTVLNLAPAFADVDIGDMLTLSVSNNSNPGLVTAELTGSQLTLSYLPDQVGTAEITIRATDSSTPGLWVDDTFTVTVNPDNFAPTVSNPIADMTIDAGAPDTVMYLSDVFADNTGVEPTLDYTAIEIDPVTGAPSAGTGLFGYKFTLYGHDGADASFATTSLTFTGPIQQLLAFGSANVDDEFFANTFEGIAGSGYIAALDTWINQGWQLIAPGDTSLSGTPVVVSASSGTSTLYQSKDILHLVATGAVQWDGLFARRGKTYETSGTADGNRLVLSVEDNTNMDLVTASMLGSRLTLAYAPGAAGQADITVRATDPEGAWIEETFTVTVVGSGTEVVARHVFYNNSVWDGNDPAAGSSDDGAIATDKMVLLPAGAASSSNYSSYSRGINGIMVDFDYLGVAPTADDFGIRVNELGYSDTWSPGPTPTVTVRPGDGVSGSDRVTLIWADGAITNTWLEVTVKSGGGINLEADDVFYFGNAVGEADGDSVVGTGDYDVLIAQFGQRGSPLDADFNGDAMVDLADFAIVRSNYGKILPEAPVLSGDADGNGVVDGVDYEILVGQFGRRGASLVGDFNGDQRVDLTDFAILRGNLGNTLPPAAPVVPVASPSLDIRNAANADDSSITAGGPAPVVDLLAEFPSADDHIPISPPVSVGSSATTFYRAATVGYDLRSLSDDLPTDAESDLSADILAESLLNGSYQLLTVSFQLR